MMTAVKLALDLNAVNARFDAGNTVRVVGTSVRITTTRAAAIDCPVVRSVTTDYKKPVGLFVRENAGQVNNKTRTIWRFA